MGKKKPNPKRNHRNTGSKDAADLQKSSDLDVASSGNSIIVNKKSTDDDRRNFVVEDSTSSIPDVGLNNAIGIEQHDDASEVANRTTNSSCSISLPISACGENDEGKSSSSSFSPSSEEKLALALALTDEDTSFIGNLSMDFNDDHEVETINNGYPTRNANDHIMQQPFHAFTEEQNQHYVKGVVGGNEEGGATSDEEKRARWTSALKEASSSEDTLEKMNDEHGAMDQSKSDSNSRETSSPRVERSEHNDQGVTNIIEQEARSDGLKRVRWTTTLEEVMTPPTSFEAEDVCGNGMAEQWIRKMIQNIISRSCFCKAVRHDSTTPKL